MQLQPERVIAMILGELVSHNCRSNPRENDEKGVAVPGRKSPDQVGYPRQIRLSFPVARKHPSGRTEAHCLDQESEEVIHYPPGGCSRDIDAYHTDVVTNEYALARINDFGRIIAVTDVADRTCQDRQAKHIRLQLCRHSDAKDAWIPTANTVCQCCIRRDSNNDMHFARGRYTCYSSSCADPLDWKASANSVNAVGCQ